MDMHSKYQLAQIRARVQRRDVFTIGWVSECTLCGAFLFDTDIPPQLEVTPTPCQPQRWSLAEYLFKLGWRVAAEGGLAGLLLCPECQKHGA